MHRIKQAIARRKTPSHPQHLETETQTTSMQRNIRNQKFNACGNRHTDDLYAKKYKNLILTA